MPAPSFRRTLFRSALGLCLLVVAVGGWLGSELDLATERDAQLVWRLLVGAVTVVVAILGGAYGLNRYWRNPLNTFQNALDALSPDSSERRLSPPATPELATIAHAVNAVLEQNEQQLAEQARHNSDQATVLANLLEGYVAIDQENRVLSFNPAAARLLRFSEKTAKGRDLRELVRCAPLHALVEQAQASHFPQEQDIRLPHPDQQLHLQVRGTPLSDPAHQRLGTLLLFNDITRLQQLETIRRDFVANVSHELKTPITSVKGAVETLSSGALEDPEAAQRFLGIIARHADRLNAIIDDLLALSRIEQGGQQSLDRQNTRIRPIILQAFQTCEIRAGEKHIRLENECDPDLSNSVNSPLLEQALVNLVDNAIKYSEPETTIRVRACTKADDLLLEVEDEGVGIEAKHHDRLFERFYRVDTARSRKLGGTGLGLAIVKHISQAHGGQVQVRSVPNQGSCFTLRLPIS